jgi:predicted transcriptional regulator
MGRRRNSDKAQRGNSLTRDTVTVHIKYQETEQTFTGDANQVWISINRFFTEMLPALQTLKKALLTVDLEILIEDIKNVIAIAPEGPVLLVSKQKLTDSETLTLHLLAAYVGNKLGQTKNTLSKEELQAGLGKSAKITSTRIGELIREGLATKTEEGNYKITTLGIKRFQEESLPEIREKLQR